MSDDDEISRKSLSLAISTASSDGPHTMVRSRVDPFPDLYAIYPVATTGPTFVLDRAIARVDMAHEVATVTDHERGEELARELARIGFEVTRCTLEQ